MLIRRSIAGAAAAVTFDASDNDTISKAPAPTVTWRTIFSSSRPASAPSFVIDVAVTTPSPPDSFSFLFPFSFLPLFSFVVFFSFFSFFSFNGSLVVIAVVATAFASFHRPATTPIVRKPWPAHSSTSRSISLRRVPVTYTPYSLDDRRRIPSTPTTTKTEKHTWQKSSRRLTAPFCTSSVSVDGSNCTFASVFRRAALNGTKFRILKLGIVTARCFTYSIPIHPYIPIHTEITGITIFG
jgi:hypothetical protein